MTKLDALLTVEIGTSSCKSIIFAASGAKVSEASQGYRSFYPKSNWVEQNPDDWYDTAVQTTRKCVKAAAKKRVKLRCLAFTGQMHAVVPVDRRGAALAHCMVLQDRRSEKQHLEAASKISGEEIHRISGGILDPYMPALKIMWIRENEPEIFKKARSFLPPKDYVRNRITGTFRTDPIDASGTMLYDITSNKWSNELASLLEIDLSLMPEISDPTTIDGNVSKEFSSKTGIGTNVPVVLGAGDDIDLAGVGAVEEGEAGEHIGGAGEMAAVTNRPMKDPKTRVECLPHLVPNRWVVGAPTQAAGSALRWFKESLAAKEGGTERRDPYDRLILDASKAPAAADGLVFMPFLAGERGPLWNPNARGLFYGLSFRHGREHFTRAVLEGIAYSLKSILDVIEELGVKVEFILSSGGGAKNKRWNQMRADIYERRLGVTNIEEAAPFAAFMIGTVAMGIKRSIGEAIKAYVRMEKNYAPIDRDRELYRRAYRSYCNLISSLTTVWKSG